MMASKPAKAPSHHGTAWARRMAADYLGMLLVLVALIALFSALSDHFLQARTFLTIANQYPDLMVIAVGMTARPVIVVVHWPSA